MHLMASSNGSGVTPTRGCWKASKNVRSVARALSRLGSTGWTFTWADAHTQSKITTSNIRQAFFMTFREILEILDSVTRLEQVRGSYGRRKHLRRRACRRSLLPRG